MKTFLNRISLGEFLSLVEGEIYMNGAYASRALSYVCTDSREVEADSVFIALVGERTDGHKYIDVAVKNNAALVICERLPEICENGCAYAVTENSEKALLALAYNYRVNSCRDLKAVAVTGSVGKTTAKEIIYAALSEKLDVYKTDGNFNSVIGMPLSLVGMRRDYRYAVYEMGMSALGEISSMTRTLMPYVGVITNVGHSHLEYLGTRENILKAKLEITEGIPDDGYLVINADDEMLSGVDYSQYPFTTVRCSQKLPDADFYAFNVRFTDKNSMLFDVKHGTRTYSDVEIAGVGRHLVTTALCAIAAGDILGLSVEDCVSGFANYKNASMRQNIITLAGCTVIEDCYNAAPESTCAAIDALVRLKAKDEGSRAVALLGDMKELGNTSKELHSKVGEYAAKSGVDTLITFGELSSHTSEGARIAGMNPDNLHHLCDLDPIEESGRLVTSLLKKGDILLVKASRSMRGERIIDYLKEIDKK